MKPILLCLVAVAAFLLFSSATPLDKRFDEFNRILGLDIPKLYKNSVSKKIKPPGKLPGPKLFQDAMGLGFPSQIPSNIIPKITSFDQDDNHRRKKHLLKNFAPLHEEPKKQWPIREDANKEDGTITLENKNKKHLRKLEKLSAMLPVNPQK